MKQRIPSFNDFVFESSDVVSSYDEAIFSVLEDIIKFSKQHKGEPVLYRGFTNTRNIGGKNREIAGTFLTVIEDRKSTYGNIESAKLLLDGVKKRFKFKSPQPTFVTPEMAKAKLFGTPYIFIPKDPYRFYYNPEVKDVWVKHEDINQENLQELIDGYEEVINIKNIGHHEILADSKEYYLLHTKGFVDNLPKKWQKEIQTYSDVLDFAQKWKWLKNKQKEDNKIK